MRHKFDRVLGLDPGFARTGYAVLERNHGDPRVLEYGCIETHAREAYPIRLLTLETRLQDLLDRFHPELVALEKLFFCKNVATAMNVGQARGVLIVTLARQKLPTLEFTPQEIKITATGYGNADKRQVQRMIQKLLALAEPPTPDDAADALAIALTALAHQQR